MTADSLILKDYRGNPHGRGVRYQSDHGRSIIKVNDRTTNHMLLSDNGVHVVEMRRDRVRKACKKRKTGSYYFEHNQGNGGWSAGVSILAFNISYSSDQAVEFRAAAKYNYFN